MDFGIILFATIPKSSKFRKQGPFRALLSNRTEQQEGFVAVTYLSQAESLSILLWRVMK